MITRESETRYALVLYHGCTDHTNLKNTHDSSLLTENDSAANLTAKFKLHPSWQIFIQGQYQVEVYTKEIYKKSEVSIFMNILSKTTYFTRQSLVTFHNRLTSLKNVVC